MITFLPLFLSSFFHSIPSFHSSFFYSQSISSFFLSFISLIFWMNVNFCASYFYSLSGQKERGRDKSFRLSPPSNLFLSLFIPLTFFFLFHSLSHSISFSLSLSSFFIQFTIFIDCNFSLVSIFIQLEVLSPIFFCLPYFEKFLTRIFFLSLPCI